MKLKIRTTHHTAIGDYRVIKKFTVIPLQIYDEKYWLQFVYIKQKYVAWQSGFSFGNHWVNICFTNSNAYLLDKNK